MSKFLTINKEKTTKSKNKKKRFTWIIPIRFTIVLMLLMGLALVTPLVSAVLVGDFYQPPSATQFTELTDTPGNYTNPDADTFFVQVYNNALRFYDLISWVNENFLNLSGGVLTGDLYARNIFPNETLTYELGSGALRWKKLWVQDINAENIDTFTIVANTINVSGNITALNLNGTNTGDQVASDFNHNDLSNTQGGSTDENYHLNQSQHTDLTDGGNTDLHIHDGRYYTETETDNLLDDKADSSDLDDYVPYVGATADVDLGTNKITTTGVGRFGKLFSNTDSTWTTPDISLGSIMAFRNTGDQIIYFGDCAQGARGRIQAVGAGNHLDFYTAPGTNYVGTVKMRIEDLGNVGIGKTNPSYKLDVAGAIRAETSIIGGTASIPGVGIFRVGLKETSQPAGSGHLTNTHSLYDNFTASGAITPNHHLTTARDVNLGTKWLYHNQFVTYLTGNTSTTGRVQTFYARPYLLDFTGNISTLVGFVTDPYFWGATTGTATNVYGMWMARGANGGGSAINITNWHQLRIENPVTGDNKVGLYIGDITGGSVSNYAIYSEGGDSYHAGDIVFGGDVTATDFITSSKVADVNDDERALDDLENMDEWLNKDGELQYDKHYAYVNGTRTIIIGNNVKNETVCQELEDEKGIKKEECWEEEVSEPVYSEEEYKGLSMETRVAQMEKMIYELKEENTLIKSELCKKDSSYSFCKVVGELG